VGNGSVIINSDLRRMWNEALGVHFKILSQHLSGDIEHKHKNPSDVNN
jgi:hypothetical protein